MTENKSPVASFTISTYTLTYTAGANGSISGDHTADRRTTAASGSLVTAVPNTGYQLPLLE